MYKKKTSLKLTIVEVSNITGHLMLCKAKANMKLFHAVRLGLVWVEQSRAEIYDSWSEVTQPDTSVCLCRLLLFPLGIPADLHLRQLDVADDIGVWKNKDRKEMIFFFFVREEFFHQCSIFYEDELGFETFQKKNTNLTELHFSLMNMFMQKIGN